MQETTTTMLEQLKGRSPDLYRHLVGLIKSLVRSTEPPNIITQARLIDLPALRMEADHGIKTFDRTEKRNVGNGGSA